MKTKTLLSTALATAGMAIAVNAGNANAATLGCNLGTVTAGGHTFNACYGAESGNDATGSLGNPLFDKLQNGIFSNYTSATGTWKFIGKSDDQNAPISITPSDSPSGNWSVTSPLSGPFVISLKSSTFYSAYLFDIDKMLTGEFLSGIMGGTFNTAGVSTNKKGAIQDLSHASLFTFAPNPIPPNPIPPNTETVPEPFTILGSGLALGFGAMFKRKQAAKKQNA